jgi:hypothetical protein
VVIVASPALRTKLSVKYARMNVTTLTISQSFLSLSSRRFFAASLVFGAVELNKFIIYHPRKQVFVSFSPGLK